MCWGLAMGCNVFPLRRQLVQRTGWIMSHVGPLPGRAHLSAGVLPASFAAEGQVSNAAAGLQVEPGGAGDAAGV